jgi:hypothetical protein
MSRRFSDEPINLIHRIPSPEQLDAARPVKRSFSAQCGDAAASFARSVAELLAHLTSPRRPEVMIESNAALQEGLCELPSEAVIGEGEPSHRTMGAVEPRGLWPEEVARTELKKYPANPSSGGLSSVQPEELAELRAYLLTQQQDIVRLAAQIQELKSLVASQQQIIEYLGKEVAAGSVSLLTAGITSAVAKQNRSARPKPIMKDKAVVSKGDPIGLPLNV